MLFRSTTQQPPVDDFNVLVQELRKLAEAMPLDATPLADLEEEVRRLFPEQQPAYTPTPMPGQVKGPYAAPGTAPHPNTTTGRVWVIADACFARAPDNANWKEIRAHIIADCKAQNINESTAATQYSKWKAAKTAAKAA